MTGVLAGMRVLDFSRLLPGPYCSWLLADQGAEVIRVENPRELAKQAQVFGWDRLDEQSRRVQRAQDMLARGKKSVVLDIGMPAAQAVLARLAATVDVVIEDYRPGVLAGLELGYESLKAANPALVYASLTLCGQTGPYRDKPGHDPVALALAGVLSRIGEDPDAPTMPGVPMADIITGTHAAFAILAAFTNAKQTREGRYLDVAMTDCSMMLLSGLQSRYADPTDIPPRGTRRADVGLWRCADDKWLCTTDMEPRYWAAFCHAMGRPEYIPWQLDADRRQEIRAGLEALFAGAPRAHWLERLEAAGTQFAPVLEISEALSAEHQRVRGVVRKVAMPDGSSRLHFGPPVRFDDGTEHSPAAMPGAHNAEVLADLGLTAAEITALTDWEGQGGDKTGARPPETVDS